VKTHKSLEIARLQVDSSDPCVTVSTLAEAQFFSDGGFDDICWALPLAPCHLDSALDLARECSGFSVLVDHPTAVDRIQQRAAARAQQIRVWLKVDCGYHRSGVDPMSPDTHAIAASIDRSPWTELQGLLAHGGHSYGARTPAEIQSVAQEERDSTVMLSQRLRQAGIHVPAVSIGSTPTLRGCSQLSGVDEIRPGNYIFFDRSQVAIGSCTSDEIAATVLGTVISRFPARRTAIVDVGGLALSKDSGESCLDYGKILDIEGRELEGLRLVSLSQEHGKILAEPGYDLPKIHEKLRIHPNHSCLSAANFPEYHAHRGQDVIDIWRPIRGWSMAHGRR